MYQYIIENDGEKPIHLNWKLSIYKQSGSDLVRAHIDYAGTRGDAEKAARDYIDMWIKESHR